MNILRDYAPKNQNLVSNDFYENMTEKFQCEYPIIWYEPTISIKERISLINMQQEKNSINDFANFEDASEFIHKLITMSIGLIFVVSADYDERDLQQDFEGLEKLICCRLSKFEEKLLFKRFDKSISSLEIQFKKAYKFFTKNEFNHEAPVYHSEEVLVMKEVKEMAKEFSEELFIWYDSSLKLSNKEDFENALNIDKESVFPYDFKVLSEKLHFSPEYPYHLILTGKKEAAKIIDELGGFKGLLRIYVCFDDAPKLSIPNSKVVKTENLKEFVPKIEKEFENRRKFDLPAFITTSEACNKQRIYDFHIFLKKLNYRDREQAKKDFLSLAEQAYPREKDRKHVDEFAEDYTDYAKRKIFNWYTKISPINKLTNNCLRIATSDSITYGRFVFKDLEKAIQEHYREESKNFSGIVYRTAYLSQDEWTQLERNQGQEVEMLGFLSTSKNKEQAMKFLNSKKVLVEIIIPPLPELDAQGFADITEFSKFKQEEEILFNVRSRFQILKTGIENDKDNQEFRHVLLLYGDPSLSSYIMKNIPSKRIKVRSPSDENGNPSWKCDDCGEFAEEVHYKEQNLERKKTAHRNCPECFQLNQKRKLDFSSLAEENPKVLWLEDNGDFDMAPFDFQNSSLTDSGQLSQGDLFLEIKKYQECIEYCERRLNKILTKRWREQERRRLYDLIGRSSKYLSLGEKAKEYLLNHLTITEFIFGKEHPKTAISCHNLAIVYICLKENKNARKYFEASFKITQAFSHTSSLKTVKALTILATMYMILKEKNKSIQKFEEALALTLEINGELHLNTATAYNNLSIAYQSFGKDEEAIEYFRKALNASQIMARRKSPSKTASYNLLAAVFQSGTEDQHSEDKQNVLRQFLEHLEETKTILIEKISQIECSAQNLGRICKILGEVQKGLEIYIEPRDTREFTYGKEKESSVILGMSLGNLGNMYKKFGRKWESFDDDLASSTFTQTNHLEGKSLNLEEHKIQLICGYAQKCFGNLQKKSDFRGQLSTIRTIHVNLAVLHKSLGKHRKALEHANKALNIEESLFGKNHSETASLYNSLILMNNSLERDRLTFESYEAALKTKEFIFMKKNLSDIPLYFNDLALLCEHSKKYLEALEYRQEALKISELIYNKEHPETASSYNRIAILYEALENYKDAQIYYEKAQNIMKSICQKSHLDIAASYNNIASVKVILADYKKAFEDFSEAHNISISLKGRNHPRVAVSHLNLARVYRNQTEHAKERESCEEALKIFESVYGEKHPMVAASLNGIAIACSSLGEFLEAEKSQIKAFKISSSIHGIKHLNTAASFNNLANLYANQDKIDMALKFSSKAFEITRSIYGESHSEIASSLNNIAYLYGESKDYKNALKYQMEALKITESVYKKNHPQIALSYNNIALIYEEMGEKEEAENNFKKAFQHCESNKNCPPSEIATISRNFALMYKRCGNEKKALGFFEKALEIREKHFGEKHPETKDLYENLVSVCESLGDAQKADEYFQKANPEIILELSEMENLNQS